MRKSLLNPPRDAQVSPSSQADPPPSKHRPQDPPVGRLEEPAPARERRRKLFHPRRGWFRRLERRLNNWLAATVFSRIPGIAIPYDFQLRRSLTLSEAEIALPGLDAGWDGARVLLVTDIHAGPFVSPRVLGETFDRLLALEPELILLGGDMTTCRLDEFDANREAFRKLRAPLGVYAVLGNHDHYTQDPARLTEMLEEEGIRVLHNEWVQVERGGGRLTLSGVDDMNLGHPDMDAALDGAPSPTVLLCHNPDLLFEAVRRDVGLMLAGHTHAGQIRIPGLPVIVRQSRYRLDEGRYRSGGTELIVSRGLGAVGLPLRMACPPEAVMIQLRTTGD
jgi:predicted MPP superfamily phosphohydrolase